MKKLTVLVRWLAASSAALLLFLVPAISGCTVERSFRGPGFDPERGVIAPGAGDTVVVAITHAVLDDDTREPFDERIFPVLDSLEQQAGFVGYSARKQLLGSEVWTLSVWTDYDALYAFVGSDIHYEAMRAGADAIRLLRTHEFELPAAELPLSWERGLELLDEADPPPAHGSSAN